MGAVMMRSRGTRAKGEVKMRNGHTGHPRAQVNRNLGCFVKFFLDSPPKIESTIIKQQLILL